MKIRIPWRKRLQYTLDNLFSSGPWILILWLGIASLVVTLLAAIVLTSVGLAPGVEAPFNFSEAFWLSLIRSLGGGSIGGRESAWGYRLLMLGVSLGGIFFTSSLIGILTTGLNARLETLRKGRSTVVESNHIVILGWTEQIFSIISELAQANADQKHACIVVLGEADKIDMEEHIRQKVGDTGRTRIVCRSGSPMEMEDLKITSFNQARAILVLSPESENPDADVIKIILAITNHPQRRKEPYHIIAGVRSPRNYEITRIVGKGEVEWVRSGEMTARIIAQTCRQSGLSMVYTGLLDFGSDEIYFHTAAEAAGRTFGEIIHHFPHDTLIGIRPQGEPPRLNPPDNTVITAGDELILIARDNDEVAYLPAPEGAYNESLICLDPEEGRRPEHTLVLGWNWRGGRVVHELDDYVLPGSEVLVIADRQSIEEDLQRDCINLQNQSVCFRPGDTTDRQMLEELDLGRFDHVVLLCYSDRLSPQQADARTMVTLLHLRDLADAHGYRYSIVSEMMDVRNRRIAAVTKADDFIVSDRLVSLLMAQVAENRHVNQVFTDLFNHKGSEIYLKPAGTYVRLGEPVNQYSVAEAARRKNEIAIGYRKAEAARDASQAYGVVINPAKADEVTFGERDKIIVLAEG